MLSSLGVWRIYVDTYLGVPSFVSVSTGGVLLRCPGTDVLRQTPIARVGTTTDPPHPPPRNCQLGGNPTCSVPAIVADASVYMVIRLRPCMISSTLSPRRNVPHQGEGREQGNARTRNPQQFPTQGEQQCHLRGVAACFLGLSLEELFFALQQ